MEAKPQRAAPAALWLWIAAASFYVATGAGHSTSVDGIMTFLAARELLSTGRPAVPEVPHTETHRKLGQDGRWYPKYGPASVVAHVPALLLARLGDPLRAEVGGEPASPLRRDEFYAQLTNASIAAATVACIFVVGLALDYGRATALAVSALAALASPLWTYAHVDSSEALQAFGLTASACCLLSARRSPRSGPGLFAAGALLAVAVAAKVTNLVLVPWFFLYVLVAGTGRVRLWNLAIFAAPLALGCVALGLYNFYRFGAWLDTGYDLSRERFDRPLGTGALTLLASPQFGLLVFFPAISLGVLGLREAFTRFRPEALLAAAVGVTLLLVHARWWAFWGMNWGPRFLVPAIPLLSLFLLPVIAHGARLARTAVLAAALIGAAVQSLSVAVSFFPQVWVVYEELGLGAREGLVRDPRLAPLRIAVWHVGLAADRALNPRKLGERIAHPPWEYTRPWRDPDRAVERLPQLVGLDLWAAPASWRRDYVAVWPFNERAAKPTSGRLAIVAVLGMLAGGAGLRWSLGAARDRGSKPDEATKQP